MHWRLQTQALAAFLLPPLFFNQAASAPVPDPTSQPGSSLLQPRPRHTGADTSRDDFSRMYKRLIASVTHPITDERLAHLSPPSKPGVDDRKVSTGKWSKSADTAAIRDEPAEGIDSQRMPHRSIRTAVTGMHWLARREDETAAKYSTIFVVATAVPGLLIGLGLASIAVFGNGWRWLCGRRRDIRRGKGVAGVGPEEIYMTGAAGVAPAEPKPTRDVERMPV